MLDKLYYLVVPKYFFVLIVVDGASELLMFGVLPLLILVLFDSFNNFRSELLSVITWFHEKCLPDDIRDQYCVVACIVCRAVCRFVWFVCWLV
jgi:hypothetical protein